MYVENREVMVGVGWAGMVVIRVMAMVVMTRMTMKSTSSNRTDSPPRCDRACVGPDYAFLCE